MLAHRGQQFIGRLNWDLPGATRECEIDQYDAPGTTYCVVEKDGAHAASLRLRAPDTVTMTEDAFGHLWAPVADTLADGLEVTRFCAAPDLHPDERSKVVSQLLQGLCEYCLERGVERVYGVVFPAVARTIRCAGWHGVQHIAAQSDVGMPALMEWRVDEFVTCQIADRTSDILDMRYAMRAAGDSMSAVAIAA